MSNQTVNIIIIIGDKTIWIRCWETKKKYRLIYE